MSSRTVIPISAHPQIGKIDETAYHRLYRGVAGGSRPLLGRARQARRLDQAVHQGEKRLVRG